MLSFKLALIGEDLVVLPLEEADGTLRDDAVLLAQRDEPAVEREDGVIVLALCLDIDDGMVAIDAEPRRACGPTRLPSTASACGRCRASAPR